MFIEDQKGAIIQGIQDGIKEGIKKREIALILRQLARCVGEIEPEIEIRIRQLSLEQIESLAEAMFDFTSPQDLSAWLQVDSE